MVAIITSLNAAYNLPEGRAWWKRRLVSLGLTIALAALILTALALLLYGGETARTFVMMVMADSAAKRLRATEDSADEPSIALADGRADMARVVQARVRADTAG